MDDHTTTTHHSANTNHSPYPHILLVDRWLAETRMARVCHGVVEDFDQEIDSHRLKKGNIYMGRVMRIEPSLQAVFVDFGFDKHGFLAFSDIAFPVDPEGLVPTELPSLLSTGLPAAVPMEAPESLALAEGFSHTLPVVSDDIVHDAIELPLGDGTEPLTEATSTEATDLVPMIDQEAGDADPAETTVSSVGLERDQKGPARSPKKLLAAVQAWVKANPLIMVQVTKDERGGKGAALTTFIALSGRYGFFLPNTPGSHGVSKKITTATTRQYLQQVLQSLDIPPGMSVILRSAAADRKKSEIKRDYDYVVKKWLTIQHSPQDHIGLVLAEDPLLIRCLRDSRLKEVDAIYVEGHELYKQARHYVRAVMPSYLPHLHLGAPGLFATHRVEEQIASLYDAKVHLPSGGAIVITPTEALVSIDVNSAKATQKKNVNDTALATNLEAAAMIARHLRLRDLAGLIVIDFIDLPAHKRSIVEKALKEALAQDRARIKIGKISEFGLLEMSRQCLRQSLMETNTSLCPSCGGAGRLMSCAMQMIQALRDLDRWACMAQGRVTQLAAAGNEFVIVAILNHHRSYVSDLEQRYGLTIHLSIHASHHSSGPVAGLTLITPLEVVNASVSTSDTMPHTTKSKKKKARRKKKNTASEGSIPSDPASSSLVGRPQATDQTSPTDAVTDAAASSASHGISNAGTTSVPAESIGPGDMGADEASAGAIPTKNGGKNGGKSTRGSRRQGRGGVAANKGTSVGQGGLQSASEAGNNGALQDTGVLGEQQAQSGNRAVVGGDQGISRGKEVVGGQGRLQSEGKTEADSGAMGSGGLSDESAPMVAAASVAPAFALATDQTPQPTPQGALSSGGGEASGGVSKRRRGKSRAGHHTKDVSDSHAAHVYAPHHNQASSSQSSLAQASATRSSAAQASATRGSSGASLSPQSKERTRYSNPASPRNNRAKPRVSDALAAPSVAASTAAGQTRLGSTAEKASASPIHASIKHGIKAHKVRLGPALSKKDSLKPSKAPQHAKRYQSQATPASGISKAPDHKTPSAQDKSIILPPLVTPRKRS